MGAKYVFNPLTGNLDTTDVVAFNGEVNLGTAAAPSVFFTGDTNTGIYSPGADQVAISTNGTGRLFIESSGNVGIGSSSPGALLDLNAGGASSGDQGPELRLSRNSLSGAQLTYGDVLNTLKFQTNADTRYYAIEQRSGNSTTSSTLHLAFEGDGTKQTFLSVLNSGRVGIGTTSPQQPLHIKNAVSSACRLVLENTGSSSPASTQVWSQNNDLVFDANGGEAVRIDSARRLLVGMSSDSGNTTLVLQGNSAGATGTPTIAFKRNILPAVNNDIAIISFSNVTGGEGARLQVEADGAWTNGSSHPTRLVFSVTADGASSPTEAMRIKNTRVINFSNAPVYADNAAAKTGGLVDGDVYRTSTGDLKIVYT